MMTERKVTRTVDWWIIAAWMVLMLIGLASISSSVHSLELPFWASRGGKQLLWMMLSAGVGALILFGVRARMWEVVSLPAYGVVLALLLAVIAFGTTVNGSKSWFTLGPFSFQPSELSKITTSLLLAHELHTLKMNSLKDLLIVLGTLAVPMIVILAEGETGTLLVYLGFLFVLYREGLSGWWVGLAFGAVILFVLSLTTPPWVPYAALAGMVTLYYTVNRFASGFITYQKKVRTIVASAVATVLGVAMVLSTNYVFGNILKPYQKQRIEVLLGLSADPMGVGYNVNQSLIAIGSGGLFGKGYMQGTQTAYGFVPEQSTDFIFCTIGEEAGFLGCAAVIAVFCFLIVRIILDAERSREAFTRIYGYCVAACLMMHMTINIGMTIGLVPVIGIPLPFISYGGSSLLSFTVLLFIFLALVKQEKKFF